MTLIAGLLLLACCHYPAQHVDLNSLATGARPFCKEGKMVIRTLRRKTWMGDSAKMMRPYPLLDQGVAEWNRALGMDLDPSALAEIEFSIKAHAGGNGIGKKKFERQEVWKGKPLLASGGATRAVNCVPIYQKRAFRRTDSTFQAWIEPTLDDQSGPLQTLRKFKFHGMRGLLLRYDELCHADRKYTYANYLLFRRDGLLHSVVMLEEPCSESRGFAYLLYEWDEESYLRRLTSWSMSESEFAEETGIQIMVHEW